MNTSFRAWGVITLLFLTVTPVWAGTTPPYYDKNRSLKRQWEAANKAKKAVRDGAKPDEVFSFLANPSAHVRDAVYKELIKSAPDGQLKSIMGGLNHSNPLVAASIAEVYTAKKFAKARPALEKMMRSHRHELVRAQCAVALAAIGDSSSMKALKKALKKDRHYMVRGEALISLSIIDFNEARDSMENALTDKFPGTRLAALELYKKVDGAKSQTEAALTVLKAKTPKIKQWGNRLLFGVCELLQSIEKKGSAVTELREVIGLLIKRMEKADGRPLHEIGETLREVTGEKSLGDKAYHWKSWWEMNKGSWDPRTVKTGDGKKDPATVVRYHGVPIYSKRLGFLLDLSGGMDRPIGNGDTARRLDFAKVELNKTLSQLPADVLSNVLFFGTTYFPFAKTAVPLKRNRGKMIDFVTKQKISKKPGMARSNMYDSMVLTLDKPEVDTMFILTEGGPTEGKYVNDRRFRKHLKRLNRYMKVKIYTLLIADSQRWEKWLRKIAEESGAKGYKIGEKRKGFGGK